MFEFMFMFLILLLMWPLIMQILSSHIQQFKLTVTDTSSSSATSPVLVLLGHPLYMHNGQCTMVNGHINKDSDIWVSTQLNLVSILLLAPRLYAMHINS